MTRTVALLRGVNVGGSHKLAMAKVREVFGEAGGEDVVTYIQSGNVVFTHSGTSMAKLQADLQRRLGDVAGFTVPVMLRSRTELKNVVDANPFPGVDGIKLHVVFLDGRPPRGALDSLDLAAFAPEDLVARGRELYLHLPNGMGRAKLPEALTKLGRRAPSFVGTARNWRTVVKLLELATP
jgi:uncharacterized protein (DUF1697 family)